MHRALLLLLLSAFIVCVTAFDPVADAECASDRSICLTSFKWCSTRKDGGCAYPDGADAFIPGSTSSPYAMLYHGNRYKVTWKQAIPGVPVRIEWLFSEQLYRSLSEGWGRLEVMWSTNTTEDSFVFDPHTILMSFPTPEWPNITSWQAIVASHDVSNHLRVSQPDASDDRDAPAVSDQFLVHTGWTAEFVRNVRRSDADLYDQQRRNWQIGVGAGIGIGMPLLVVLSWWMGHRLGTRAGYDMATKVARRRHVI